MTENTNTTQTAQITISLAVVLAVIAALIGSYFGLHLYVYSDSNPAYQTFPHIQSRVDAIMETPMGYFLDDEGPMIMVCMALMAAAFGFVGYLIGSLFRRSAA